VGGEEARGPSWRGRKKGVEGLNLSVRVMGGGGCVGSAVRKLFCPVNFHHTANAPPLLIAYSMTKRLFTNNYLCTYDLYGPVCKVFDAGRYITWGSGGGGGRAGNLKNLTHGAV
jgi:hypothetical protein